MLLKTSSVDHTQLYYGLEQAGEKLGMSETVLVRLSQYFKIPANAYETEGYLSFKGELQFSEEDLRFFRMVRERLVSGESLDHVRKEIHGGSIPVTGEAVSPFFQGESPLAEPIRTMPQQQAPQQASQYITVEAQEQGIPVSVPSHMQPPQPAVPHVATPQHSPLGMPRQFQTPPSRPGFGQPGLSQATVPHPQAPHQGHPNPTTSNHHILKSMAHARTQLNEPRQPVHVDQYKPHYDKAGYVTQPANPASGFNRWQPVAEQGPEVGATVQQGQAVVDESFRLFGAPQVQPTHSNLFPAQSAHQPLAKQMPGLSAGARQSMGQTQPQQ